MKNKLPRWLLDLIFSLFSALLLGVILAVFSVGNFFQSWLALAGILWVSFFALVRTWRYLGSARSLAIVLAVAFFVRIGMAVLVSAGLPVWGYDNPVNNAGFLYSDAYDRDQAAFKLASSDSSLFTAFTAPDKTDQYGGLLFLSAVTYRTLSPDADRPLLISLLAALVMTLGIAFFWSAVQKHWNLKIALIASWILSLFPDSVFLGSSQMREPFLIGLACIAFWAVLDWQKEPLKAFVISVITLTLVCLFSLPAGGVIFAILVAVVVLEASLAQKKSLIRTVGFIILGVVGITALVAGWMWLRSTIYYDSYTTWRQSGWIQELLLKYGNRWMIPFTSIYGLLQPVLPAAITDSAVPFWRVIAILRSLGWYGILPFLFFSLFSSIKAKSSDSKWILVLFNFAFMIWVVVSSMRAGGDEWDNPRYRYILLPFAALLAAWSLDHYQRSHSPWFWRWVAVEGEFLLLFMVFYLNRYITLPIKLSLPVTVISILLLAVLILVGGWIWDVIKRQPQIT